jgi:hypothetical protein
MQLDPTRLGSSATVDMYPFTPDDSYWYLEDVVVRRPTSGMDVTTTRLYVMSQLYFSESDSLLIGFDVVPHNTYSRVEWLSFGGTDSQLAASMVAAASDDFGRESYFISNGTVDTIGFTGFVTLGSPPVPSSPAAGATGVATAPTISFAGMSGAALHFVELSDDVTGATWTILVPATQSSVTLPTLPMDGLGGGRNYSWRVWSFTIPAFNYHSYLDGALTTALTAYSVSETRGFRTR